ncbi:glycosyltransferase [Patescibacteria group bacterium]|nr:glycosyltransferase [Patescibacteria group bacterium]
MTHLSVVCLTTYPPRECGIATFSQDFLSSIRKIYPKARIRIAALNKKGIETPKYPREVCWQLDQDNPKDFLELARELNKEEDTFVVIQHEYGIYGGENGANLMEFMDNYENNVFTIFHTVLPKPTDSLREITQRIIDKSTMVQVFTNNSKMILDSLYKTEKDQVVFVPHGIHPVVFRRPEVSKPRHNLDERTVLTTFGMLSRSKGIEYFIKALPEIVNRYPEVIYLVIGATHPVVKKEEGESYREELEALVEKLGLKNHVRFVNKYLPTEEILSFLQATDIYISTSTSPDQAVSGTFSYALGTGRAIVSTAFRQAKNIITRKIGRLVPICDSGAYAKAVLELLDKQDLLPRMNQAAYRLSRGMLWSNIGYDYMYFFEKYSKTKWSFLPKISLKHLEKMTDKNGLLQFSKFSNPLPESGYTLDDNARAIIACIKIGDREIKRRDELKKMIQKYLNLTESCRGLNGAYVNYLIGDNLDVSNQNTKEDFQDSLGRLAWCFGELSSCEWIDEEVKSKSRSKMFKLIKEQIKLDHIRAVSFSIMGITAGETNGKEFEVVSKLSKKICDSYDLHSGDDWWWYEAELKYANGIIPLSLLKAGEILKCEKCLETAFKSLEFLRDECFFDVVYVPIGQEHWYKKGGKRSLFDQQPEDPTSSVMAFMEAYRISGDAKWSEVAMRCFSWFLGNNILGKRLYNDVNASCYDGLNPEGVNLNQGAESLVSYLIARTAILG